MLYLFDTTDTNRAIRKLLQCFTFLISLLFIGFLITIIYFGTASLDTANDALSYAQSYVPTFMNDMTRATDAIIVADENMANLHNDMSTIAYWMDFLYSNASR